MTAPNGTIDFTKLSEKTQHWIAQEEKYVAIYYPPIPVIVERGERCYVWDVDGKRYFDCMGGFASVSQGHCHPKIVKALQDQASKLTMSSRSLYNHVFPETAKYLTEVLGYEDGKWLASSGGTEACESACKLSRKWGYKQKGVPEN